MSVYDTLEQDEEYESFRTGIRNLFAKIDDPEEFRATLQEQGYEDALEHIDLDQDTYETRLEILQTIAENIRRRNPELLDKLSEELETEPSDE